MHFSHHSAIWAAYPELVVGALWASGVHRDVRADAQVERLEAAARARLQGSSESELPEIQAWRRIFARMGLKPTQYRCASESLLRRLRKEDALPRIHPLIDLCNAASMAYATPVAVFDLAKVSEWLEVRFAVGDERYLTFGGETEQPELDEVCFADARGNAHARRWTNRQSGLSAVRDDTRDVLVVCEAMHPGARDDVPRLVATLADALHEVWGITARTKLLSAADRQFEFA